MTASGSQVAVQERHGCCVCASTSRDAPGNARLTEQPGNEGAGTGPSTPCPILETALFGVVAWLADRCSATSERILEIDQVTSGKVSSSNAEAKPDQSGKSYASRFLLSFPPHTNAHHPEKEASQHEYCTPDRQFRKALASS